MLLFSFLSCSAVVLAFPPLGLPVFPSSPRRMTRFQSTCSYSYLACFVFYLEVLVPFNRQVGSVVWWLQCSPNSIVSYEQVRCSFKTKVFVLPWRVAGIGFGFLIRCWRSFTKSVVLVSVLGLKNYPDNRICLPQDIHTNVAFRSSLQLVRMPSVIIGSTSTSLSVSWR